MREVGPADPSSFVQRIPRRGNDGSRPAAHLEYLALLDGCLRVPPLLASDADRLIALARRRRIGREMCEELHRTYFADLVQLGWSRGGLTPADMADLVSIGRDLSVPTYVIRGAMTRTRTESELSAEERLDGGGAFDRLPDTGLDPAA